MADLPPLLVAQLLDLDEVEEVVASALRGRVALVPLEDGPVTSGPHAVVVRAPGLSEPIVLSAEPEGEPTAGLYPLRLRPLDDKQAEKLRAERRRASELPPRDDPRIGVVLARGKYEIEALIGGGAHGRVYRARHRALSKAVAIKVLERRPHDGAEFAARFLHEARAATKIEHTNVAEVFDFGEEADGTLYMVMELVDGKSLRAVLEREGAMPTKRVVELASQVCAGLSAAHDAGIVHRDVKPENLVVVERRDDDGVLREIVKVCDFGVAVGRGGASDELEGTPEYMSPEQGRGDAVDARSDVYACGVLLYEMATGVCPFRGDAARVLVAHASDPPLLPSRVSPRVDRRLEAIIVRALEKEPEHRYASARAMRAELRRIAGVGSGETRARRTTSPPLARADGASAPAPARSTADEPPAAVVIDANAAPEIDRAPPPPADPGPPPPPIGDPSVGFSELLVAVTSAVARTTYYERAHPEFARSLAQLAVVLARPLERRGEISLVRRDQHTSDLAVMTGAGEVMDLVKAVPTGVGSACAQRLGEVFVRRALVSLTFKEGLGDDELADAVELLSGPEISGRELQAQFVARGLTKVSLLFASEMLGKERRLPWQVMLCISRVARDLAAVPKMVQRADPERRKHLRTALVADTVRALKSPEQVKLLLINWDLIAQELTQEDAAQLDIPALLVAAIAHPMLLRVASIILVEMERGATAAPPEPGSILPPPRASVRQLMHVIGNRFIRERTIESDEVLRELHSRAVLSFPELPEDVQMWVLAEQLAESLAKDPEPTLRVLDTVFDLPRYARESETLSRAMRVLARRSEVNPLWTIVVRLQQRHARGAPPGDESREGLAARALARLADAEVLQPIARALLGGEAALRDAAQGILVSCGAAGAQALCEARQAGGWVVRARFVEAMKELGRDGSKALGAMVERFGAPHGEEIDAALAEDVLRALPEIADDRTGLLVGNLLHHRAAPVRRAAAVALGAPWGPHARSMLMSALDDADEGVRVAALGGLRKVGAVDVEAVRRLEKILAAPVNASDDVCAMAAALLGDAVPEAREEAVNVLLAAIQPRGRGVMARITGAPPPTHESAFVVETIARVLLAIGGARGRDAVVERAKKASGPLKERLAHMLHAQS